MKDEKRVAHSYRRRLVTPSDIILSFNNNQCILRSSNGAFN